MVGYAELVWFKKFSLKSAGFLTMAFSAEVKVVLPPNFLKDSVVWTELCVAPASMLSFSRRAALSAAKYLLMSVFKSVSRSYFCVFV